MKKLRRKRGADAKILEGSHRTVLHTRSVDKMPAPRTSKYLHFCRCICHSGISFRARNTHIVRCARQDDQHVQLEVIVAGCGSNKSRDQTDRASRRGCLLRCLPVEAVSFHVLRSHVWCWLQCTLRWQRFPVTEDFQSCLSDK